MDLDEIKDLIAGVGFPVFVAVYLLIYFRKSLDDLKATMNKLSDTIDHLSDRLKGG